MARIIRASTETKGKQGRKVKIRRQTYPLELKKKAMSWKLVYGMKMTAIQKKLKDEYGIEVAIPTLYTWVADRKKTLCTWWKPEKKFKPKPRPEVLFALERKWFVKSTKKTEYHQSTNAGNNGPTVPHVCNLCQRRFKSKVNLTKHVFWHTINDDNRDDDPADPMEVIESQDEDELYTFTMSITITITIFCFISWMASNINHYHSTRM